MIQFTMNHWSDLLIIAVNYSHDVATAFLASSAMTMWILSMRYPGSGDAGLELYYIRVYRGVTRVAVGSLCWILIAGIPRIIYHNEFELAEMAGDLQFIAIVIKHIVMFVLLGAGLFYWSRLSRKVKILKLKHNAA